MCSPCLKRFLVLAVLLMIAGSAFADGAKRILRVAADPNNLPFSNSKLEGFENRIAELVAKNLNAELQYIWRAQRRGFFRESFQNEGADFVVGVPKGFDKALITKPYYRSSYVFVTRSNDPEVRSFDDPRMKRAKIGVNLIGDDAMNPPPAHALSARGIVTNVVGFSLYSDYSEENPTAKILRALAAKEIDVAVVWGPLGGYFAEKLALRVVPIPATPEDKLPFAFSIGMGVKKNNKALRDELDVCIDRHKAEIDKILSNYHIPTIPLEAPRVGSR